MTDNANFDPLACQGTPQREDKSLRVLFTSGLKVETGHEGTPGFVPVESKATTPNPKDLLGAQKVSISKFPMVALVHGAHAMMNGALKYGAFNWRAKPVIASIYVDALIRHVADWFEGQETATDSGVHHLGHAIACAAILLDALEFGNLIDDRPVCGDPDKLDRVLDRLKEIIKTNKEDKDGKST